MESERIFTETAKISIWDRIDILTTLNGVKQELELRCKKENAALSNDLLINKAKGVAFCLRSARDLFRQSNAKNLTPSLTSIYYGIYNLLSALLVGNVNNKLTLESVEGFSKNGGHGLKSIYQTKTIDLAADEFVYCCNNGFYKELLRNFGYDIESAVMSQNYRTIAKVPENEKQKLISLKDLLSRIPELKNIYSEIFREQPNYLNYYGSNISSKDKEFYKVTAGKFQNTTYLNTENINDILNLPPEYNFEYREEYPGSNNEKVFIHERIPRKLLLGKVQYQSPISIGCLIKPLLGNTDVLLFYFKLFYILSIWTRYRPNLWREVIEGEFDQFRSLFNILTDVSERIVPNLFLNRFYGRIFLFASKAYYS